MRVTQITQVTVLGVIAVSISAPPQAYEGIPVTVSASWNTAAGPFDGVVYFGDGASEIINTTGKTTTKTHTYAAAGTYTVKVVVKDRNTGSQGENTKPIQITAKLSATIYANPPSGNVPLAVIFTIGISGGYTPYTWTLDYGDATTPGSGSSPGTNPHTYTKVGNFTATLTATDALGASIVSRSKLSIGMEGVTIQPWAAVLAPLVAGVALVAIVKR
jgi:PKD repeat protein